MKGTTIEDIENVLNDFIFDVNDAYTRQKITEALYKLDPSMKVSLLPEEHLTLLVGFWCASNHRRMNYKIVIAHQTIPLSDL
jgi:hypothetical protein